MSDVAIVVATVAFFAASWGYVKLCERLWGKP